jgi:hypothetical protein
MIEIHDKLQFTRQKSFNILVALTKMNIDQFKIALPFINFLNGYEFLKLVAVAGQDLRVATRAYYFVLYQDLLGSKLFANVD